MRTPSRRTAIVFISLLGLVAAYGVLGAFVAPPLARKALIAQLQERLGRPVQLDRLFANPYTLQVRAEGFRILEPDGKTAFAGFDSLDLDGSASSFVHLAPVFDEARLQGLRVRIVRTDAAHYSFDDIVARLAAAARAKPADAAKEPARFSVSNIRLADGAIDFDDLPAHAKHRVTDMQLAIPFISNLPTHRRDRVQPAFSATVNGAPLHLAGEALPFENTVQTNFTLDVQKLDVPRYLAYLPADFPVRFDSGTLDARLTLRFTQAPGREPTIDAGGTAALSGVALSTVDGPLARVARIETDIASAEPLAGLIKLGAVRITDVEAMKGEWRIAAAGARDIEVNLKSHGVKVGAVDTRGGKLALQRRADGGIDMPRLPPSEHPTHWDVAIAALAVTDYAVDVRDAAVKPAALHHFTVASLEGKSLSTDHGLNGSVTTKVRLDRGGSLDASATFALEPLELKATLDARSIDLVPLRAYVAQFPAVAMRSGLASASGAVGVHDQGGKLRITYEGSAQIDKLATFDTLNQEDLLNWRRVKTSGLKLDMAPDAPLKLAIADVDVEDAYSRIVVTPDGKLNVQQLMASTAAEPNPPPAPGPPKPRDIRIDRIRFAGSRLNFTDHFIRPNYTADVGDVKGAVTQLSSDPASRATVLLAGRWDASSPVVITGTVNPLRGSLFLDIGAQGQEIDLTKLTAYSQRYAGYGITAGRLTLDVKYHVDEGKMQGRNRILVDKLTFGDKVEGPDATKLPVLFVVNLLKDKEGRINLELPVSGSLDDPKFEIGAVIAQVFTSHFAKAQSSPFSLLGGAEGGDLGFVEFDPGQAALTPASQAKLDKLVTLLQDRPGLKLEVMPATLDSRDVEALKAAALARRMAAAPKDLTKEAREKLQQQPVEVGEEDRRALASGRVEQVRAYLAEASRLGPDRVVVGDGKAAPPGEADAAHASRVSLGLR